MPGMRLLQGKTGDRKDGSCLIASTSASFSLNVNAYKIPVGIFLLLVTARLFKDR
jgi:hypothetical protein